MNRENMTREQKLALFTSALEVYAPAFLCGLIFNFTGSLITSLIIAVGTTAAITDGYDTEFAAGHVPDTLDWLMNSIGQRPGIILSRIILIGLIIGLAFYIPWVGAMLTMFIVGLNFSNSRQAAQMKEKFVEKLATDLGLID